MMPSTCCQRAVRALPRFGSPVFPALLGLLLLVGGLPGLSATAVAAPADELQIEITERGLGKEVTIRQGGKEWFMLVEVTPDNTVILRQEKDHDTYLVDESETHDRSFSDAEVDTAIRDYINSVRQQVKKQ